MRTSEIRELPDVDIEGEMEKARTKLFKFRFNAANEEMQRAGEIRQLRRDIARMKTILRERQLTKRGKEAGDASS